MACGRNSLKKGCNVLARVVPMSKNKHNSLDAQDFIANTGEK